MSMMGGAFLKGLGDAGGVMSMAMLKDIDQRQRAEEVERLRRIDRDERQQDRLELAGLRGGAGGSGGSKGGGVLAPDALVAEGGTSEELLAAKMGMSIPEYRQFVQAERSGDYSKYETEQTADSESGEYTSKGLPPSFEEFKAKKRAERASLLETYAYSDDIDKIAKSRNTDVETGLLTRAGTGDRPAQEAILTSKGKDPRETAAKASKAESEGEKAEAEAERAKADAALKGRTDPNKVKSGGRGGSGTSSSSVQSKDVDAEGYIITIRRDGSAQRVLVDGKPVKRDNFERRVDAMYKQLADSPEFYGKPPETIRAAAEKALMSTSAPAPAAKPAEGGDKFTVGKKYRDGKGNVAIYRGNGKWEPAK